MRRTKTAAPSLLDHVVSAYVAIEDTFGKTAAVVLSALMILATYGGLHHFLAEDDRELMMSSIPDGISAECHAKLLRIAYSESSVERSERTASQAAFGPADNCGDIGVVK